MATLDEILDYMRNDDEWEVPKEKREEAIKAIIHNIANA